MDKNLDRAHYDKLVAELTEKLNDNENKILQMYDEN